MDKVVRVHFRKLEPMLTKGIEFRGYIAGEKVRPDELEEKGWFVKADNYDEFVRQRYIAEERVMHGHDNGTRFYYWSIVGD